MYTKMDLCRKTVTTVCARLTYAALGLASLAGGVTQAAAAQTIWFQQPSATLANNFTVHGTPEQAAQGPDGYFTVTQWQPNPFSKNGVDTAATWNMATLTGLSVPGPLSQSQASVRNAIGATGVQIYQGTVGINLDSRDFSATGTPGALVGIMPGYQFADTAHMPFAQAGTTLVFSTQMQVVSTALRRPPNNPKYNGAAYVAMDLRFVDTTHPNTVAITVAASAFSNHGSHVGNLGFDAAGGGRIIMKTVIDPSSPYLTVLPGTTLFQNTVWTGFRPFAAAMTAANLSATIRAIQADGALLSGLGLTAASFSSNPADYALTDVHINSELNYNGPGTYVGGSVQIGLSVQNMMAALQ